MLYWFQVYSKVNQLYIYMCSIAQSCQTLFQSHGLAGSSVCGIPQARILEWVAISSRESSQPRDRTHISCISCIRRQVLCRCTTREALSSVQFSRSVVSDSLRPHELQHARPPCPSPAPRVHSDSRPSSQ